MTHDASRATTPTAAGPPRVAVFGFDAAEAAQIRRIRSIRALGYAVQSFTMRRRNMNPDFQPDWPNVHLYTTENERLGRRVLTILGAIAKMTRHRRDVARADLIIARNLDMLLIAWAARLIAGGRAPLVYECLDIHGALTGRRRGGKVLRWAERRLLSAVDMLLVSSPGFITNYFRPVQGYTGPWTLVENKIALDPPPPRRPPGPRRPEPGAPLVVGWIGTIRCAPTLALLAETADRLGERVRIHIAGVVHRHAVPDFDAVVGARANMSYAGAYAYPADLPKVYGACDVVWAQDLWQAGRNSDWLLPNRIYEASWCGCPQIAVETTQTGKRIAADGLGFTVPRADAEALTALLSRLTEADIRACSAAILARPDGEFRQTDRDLDAVLSLATNGVDHATRHRNAAPGRNAPDAADGA